MYASQRTLYGSPTQGTSVEKTKRWADESQHIQYGSRQTQIRNHRLLPRGHQRNIGRKADERNCGISGAPNGGRALARWPKESRTLRIRYTTNRFIRRIRNSFSDNRAIHLSGWHKWNSFKSERTCVFSATLLGDRVHAISPPWMSICNDKTLTQCAAFSNHVISNSKESVTTGNCSFVAVFNRAMS